MPTAQVPGFRPGRAPRKLVETRFRKEIGDKVKSELLMDCLTQVNEDQKLAAISEPDLDLEAVELPAEGPLTFEFDVEVRPEFELPKWKGLAIEKPVREFSDADVERDVAEHLGPPRTAGALRRPGGARRLHHHESDLQARRRGAGQRQRRGHPHSSGVELPRRQDREASTN